MSSAPLAFSPRLMNELVFYGSYHNNKWNQLIHTIFVPAILWSSFVLLCHTGELTSFSVRDQAAQLGLPSVVSDHLVGNAALLVYIIYAVYYVYLDRVAGLFASAVIFGLLVHANFLYQSLGATAALKVAIGVNLFSWYMQIHPGHAVFEGRKPALVDSFWQALLTAPFFVWFEVLFLLGYAPATRAELQRRVDIEIAKFQASQKQHAK